MSKSDKRTDEPLQDEDGRYPNEVLQNLITMSGYPFEIRVFHEFKKAGFDTAHGLLANVAQKAIEIDVVASKKAIVGSHEKISRLEVGALIEAKVFHSPREFIGFEAQTPDPKAKRHLRYRVAGVPSWSVPSYGGILPRCHQLAMDVVDPLLEGDWCGQWGVVEGGRSKTTKPNDPASEPKLEHPMRYVQALEDTIRACHEREVELTKAAAGWTDPFMSLEFPCLVIDVPSLHVYDSQDNSLRASQWIILGITLKALDTVRYAAIDVVTASFLPQYVRKLEDVLSGFKAVVEQDPMAFISQMQKEQEAARTIGIPSARR